LKLPQRRGIAAALVTACDTAIRGHGIGIVTALVDDSPKAREPWGERTAGNAASAVLFEALGYREDAPVRYFRKLDHPGPQGGLDAPCLQLPQEPL